MSTSISITATPVETNYGNSGSAAAEGLARIRQVARNLSLMCSIYNERRAMRDLSDEALRDMGISRAELAKECRRNFSDVPDCRL